MPIVSEDTMAAADFAIQELAPGDTIRVVDIDHTQPCTLRHSVDFVPHAYISPSSMGSIPVTCAYKIQLNPSTADRDKGAHRALNHAQVHQLCESLQAEFRDTLAEGIAHRADGPDDMSKCMYPEIHGTVGSLCGVDGSDINDQEARYKANAQHYASFFGGSCREFTVDWNPVALSTQFPGTQVALTCHREKIDFGPPEIEDEHRDPSAATEVLYPIPPVDDEGVGRSDSCAISTGGPGRTQFVAWSSPPDPQDMSEAARMHRNITNAGDPERGSVHWTAHVGANW